MQLWGVTQPRSHHQSWSSTPCPDSLVFPSGLPGCCDMNTASPGYCPCPSPSLCPQKLLAWDGPSVGSSETLNQDVCWGSRLWRGRRAGLGAVQAQHGEPWGGGEGPRALCQLQWLSHWPRLITGTGLAVSVAAAHRLLVADHTALIRACLHLPPVWVPPAGALSKLARGFH